MPAFRPEPEPPVKEPGLQVRLRDGPPGEYDALWSGLHPLVGWFCSRVLRDHISREFEPGRTQNRRFSLITCNRILKRSVFTRAEKESDQVKLSYGIPVSTEGVELPGWGDEEDETLRFSWSCLLVSSMEELLWLFGHPAFEPIETEPDRDALVEPARLSLSDTIKSLYATEELSLPDPPGLIMDLMSHKADAIRYLYGGLVLKREPAVITTHVT